MEKLIKLVYRRWKTDHSITDPVHPDEETLACFLENRLSPEKNKKIQAHLVRCPDCAKIISACLNTQSAGETKAPDRLLEWAKDLCQPKPAPGILDIAIGLKDNLLELIKTSGGILTPPGLSPAPAWRAGSPRQKPQDEIRVFKDFEDIRVEVTIENKPNRAFNLTVLAKNKNNRETPKDLRISLFKDNRELESYVTDSGKAVFEQSLSGRYKVELTGSPGQELASIILDICS